MFSRAVVSTARRAALHTPSSIRCLATRQIGRGVVPVSLSRTVIPGVVQHSRRGFANLATFTLPEPQNEPNRHYAKGSAERRGIDDALAEIKAELPFQIPIVIDGKEIATPGSTIHQHNPSSHSTILATSSQATASHVASAITGALNAKHEWEQLPFADRAAVFLKAADLVAGKYRYKLMAATMLGQGKNVWQAEIDAAAELADFLRFNCFYAQEMYKSQPVRNSPGVWNRVEYRPLEGFTYAVTPFNFTAIAGNLPCAPALLGNVVVWKPSPSALLSNYLLYQILIEAGLPPSVIQFLPGDAELITSSVLAHKDFSSLHFTGSTSVFRDLYGQISKGVVEGRYVSYPRIVAETGGKNFHIVHESADLANAVNQTVRGAFEYQGQKCSATSRLYVPSSIWEAFKPRLISETENLKIGPPDESYANFIGPVIHKGSFDKLKKVIDEAKSDPELTLLTGGTYDSSRGYFISPTVYLSSNPNHPIFNTEFFGPILAVYVYPSSTPFTSILEQVDRSGGGYALTGSVFAKDRMVLRLAEEKLRYASGNFYLNCKSTGAVVGQQPFGGARASGTNDKAGSAALLGRFVSVRSVKEEFVGLGEVGYASNAV